MKKCFIEEETLLDDVVNTILVHLQDNDSDSAASDDYDTWMMCDIFEVESV